MPFIPRQVKPPAKIALTCKVPVDVAAVLKEYAEFLDSTQEYVVIETLRRAFRLDREFQTWLAATHPETAKADHAATADQPPITAGLTPIGRRERERS
jgi:hypothetical protein